jgi:hypothetical protein
VEVCSSVAGIRRDGASASSLHMRWEAVLKQHGGLSELVKKRFVTVAPDTLLFQCDDPGHIHHRHVSLSLSMYVRQQVHRCPLRTRHIRQSVKNKCSANVPSLTKGDLCPPRLHPLQNAAVAKKNLYQENLHQREIFEDTNKIAFLTQ